MKRMKKVEFIYYFLRFFCSKKVLKRKRKGKERKAKGKKEEKEGRKGKRKKYKR